MARRWRSESTWRGYNEKTTNWLAASFRIARKKLEHQKIDGDGDNLALNLKSITAMQTNLEETRAKITKDTDQAMNTLNSRIAAVETNLEESNAKIKIDVNQDVSTLNARIDTLNKDLADTQEKNGTIIKDAKAIIKHDLTAVETNLEESKAKIKIDANQDVSTLNARIDLCNKGLRDNERQASHNRERVQDLAEQMRMSGERVQNIEEQAGQNMTTIKHDITAVETNLERQVLSIRSQVTAMQETLKNTNHFLNGTNMMVEESCEESKESKAMIIETQQNLKILWKETKQNIKILEDRLNKNDGWQQNWQHHDWR